MHHTHKYDSWPEEFLDGFTAIPQEKTAFTLMQTVDFKPFEGAIKIGRALAWDKKHPRSVWRATANGQNYVVKKVFQAKFRCICIMLMYHYASFIRGMTVPLYG